MFRVAVVYATVGFVLVQGSEYLFAALLFPEWTHRLVVVLVALGFPLALIPAWAIEITPEGVRRTRPPDEGPAASESSDAAEPPRREERRWSTALWAGGALAAVAGLAFAVWGMPAVGDRAFGDADREDEAPRSIAVLPFTDLSPEGDQQFFSVGRDGDVVRIRARLVRAREAAERALELEDLAEAHASLGAVSANYDYDFARAEHHFQRAIELDPSYVTAHYWYAQLLADLGRTEEAVRLARRARELDPLSLLARATEGRAYYLGRRFDEAIATLEGTLDRGPQLTAYLYLGTEPAFDPLRSEARFRAVLEDVGAAST